MFGCECVRVCVSVCVCMCVFLGVCVCVCVRECSLRLVEGQSSPVGLQRGSDHSVKQHFLYQLSVTWNRKTLVTNYPTLNLYRPPLFHTHTHTCTNMHANTVHPR